MRINNNMMAMNTHRQLGIAQQRGANSMEKLSSGFRINRAGDDAAGLSISEKMRAQVRGLNQASRNAQDGISMIQTAEGALSETHNILQRMRELATQSANDTNVEIDRDAIQNEMNQLSSEINRIGNTTEFNTQGILDGGAAASGVSRSSLEAEGGAAEGGKITILGAVDLGSGVGSNVPTAAGTLTILVEDANGDAATFELSGSAFDTLWGQTAAGQAGTSATASMRREALVDVLGKISSTGDFDFAERGIDDRKATLSEVANISISSTGRLTLESKIGGGDISIGGLDAAGSQFAGRLGAASSAATITGVGTDQEEAVLYGSKALKTTTEFNRDDWAGRTFTVTFNERTANITFGSDIGSIDEGTITATQLVTEFNKQLDSAFGDGAVVATIAANPNNINDTNDYFQFETNTGTGVADEFNDKERGVAPSFSIKGSNLDQILGDFVPGSKGSGGTFESTFQIGANQGQSMTIKIEDMRSLALGITGTYAGEEHESVEGARFVETESVTDGTTNNATEYALDVSDHEAATAAITVLNNAIEKVSAQRSELGAFQNRLEHTITNLDNSQENLQAAESRVRDVDMASEMMELTKQNILNQASTAMLAQANQAPQSVLQLLG